MAILCNEKEQKFTLQTKSSTYQMFADQWGVLLHTYYGKRVEECDFSYLIPYEGRGFSGNPYELGRERGYSLDALPQEYPCFGTGDYRPSALQIRFLNGTKALELKYVSYELLEEKYQIPGLPSVYEEEKKAQTLIIKLKDKVTDVYVHLYYGVLEEADVITRAVRIENRESEAIYLEKVMSSSLDFQYGNFDLITFYGTHAMEREMSRMPLHHGIQSVGSTRGVSSHHYNPFMVLAESSATEDCGSCYGVSFLYSGNFIGEVELEQIGQVRMNMGIHPENFTFEIAPGDCFYSPETVLAYSKEGLGKLSNTYHHLYRHHLCRGKYKVLRRPVLLNSWEGTYFDFNGDKLVHMAADAALLGIELFVLDDGWFGKREDDTSGLGDWTANEVKLGCTLSKLAQRINALGMKFGIWFEPECVSEDSELYRIHPDWALTIPGRKPDRSRYQLVLDFSRKEVRDHIYSQLCEVLENANIEYVKWDFNRHICDLYSYGLPAHRQGEISHRYILGLYEILEKLNQKFPHILFEGCCGGGGRFDAGMLYYTPQIWCSDDTDAIERIKIQYGTSFGYPISASGSHVSDVPNHQTKRITPLKTRATVAMSGTFGYELDINNLSEQEKEEVRKQIEQFKRYYFMIQDGTYYRLTNPYERDEIAAWEFVLNDREEALVSVVATKLYANIVPVYLKIKGLAENKWYRINGSEEKYLGGALMYGGIRLPRPQCEYDSWNYHITLEK